MAEPTNAEVRAWARAQGLSVSDRGRVPAAITAAYAQAHPQDATAAAAPAIDPAPAPPQPPAPLPTAASDPAPGPAPASPFAPPAPPAYGYPPPPPPAGTDGFAVAALVLGLLGGVLLSVLFAVLALRRIGRSGRPGKGLAVAGLVLSGVWVLGIGAAVAVGLGETAERDASGAVTVSGDVATDDLEVRDCTGPLPDDGELVTVRVVPCAGRHIGEVYASFSLEGEDYPGEKEVLRFVEGGCTREIELLLEEDQTPYELFYLYPTSTTWGRGDRSVTCLLTGPEGEALFGSVVDRARRA